jgi:hypothetical protein
MPDPNIRVVDIGPDDLVIVRVNDQALDALDGCVERGPRLLFVTPDAEVTVIRRPRPIHIAVTVPPSPALTKIGRIFVAESDDAGA